MALPVGGVLQRFLLQVLPDSFIRIRHLRLPVLSRSKGSPTGAAGRSWPGVGRSSPRCPRRCPQDLNPWAPSCSAGRGWTSASVRCATRGAGGSSPSSGQATSRPPPWTPHEPARCVPSAPRVSAPPSAEGRRRVFPRVSLVPPEGPAAPRAPVSTPASVTRPPGLSSQIPSPGPPAQIQSPEPVGHPASKRGRAVQFNPFYPASPLPGSWAYSTGGPAG